LDASILDGTQSLKKDTDTMLNGVYAVEVGKEFLGDSIALLSVGGRPSVFCRPDALYMLLETGRLGDEVILEGYWRKGLSLQTGFVQLRIGSESGGREIADGRTPPEVVVIEGTFGVEQNILDKPIRLRRTAGLRPADSSFAIIGHRGGGRNSDYLPHSENSLEILRLAPRLGCNAVEIDVINTSDGIPIVFHDLEFSTRVVREEFFVGPVSNYSWQQIRSFATLVNGEKIPRFEDALAEIQKIPEIQLVWVDIKTPEVLRAIAPIIARENQLRERDPDRPEILVGLPITSVHDAYRELQQSDRTKALCELGPEKTREIDAEVWAPRWTLGIQEGELAQMQSEGRRAFVWTVDLPEFILQFVEAGYDGILSNYPTLVAWSYYVGRDE
jgi:glycerophosphoryl diester phosphodiesterase